MIQFFSPSPFGDFVIIVGLIVIIIGIIIKAIIIVIKYIFSIPEKIRMKEEQHIKEEKEAPYKSISEKTKQEDKLPTKKVTWCPHDEEWPIDLVDPDRSEKREAELRKAIDTAPSDVEKLACQKQLIDFLEEKLVFDFLQAIHFASTYAEEKSYRQQLVDILEKRLD